MKLIITENQYRILKNYLIESEEEEYYKISPQDFIKEIKKTNYDVSIFDTRKYKGLPIYVTGNLNLSGLPIDSLDNVVYIDGYLDISETEIRNLDGTEVRGYTSDSGSVMDKIRIKKEEDEKMSQANQRRKKNEWDLDNPDIDEVGLAANALFKNLVDEGVLSPIDDEKKEELERKKERIIELGYNIENNDSLIFPMDPNVLYKAKQEFEKLTDELYEMESKLGDVYNLIPLWKPFGLLHAFEVNGNRDKVYWSGKDNDFKEAAIQSVEELFDDVGAEAYSSWVVENNLDNDKIKEYLEAYYSENEIRDNPESYFNEDDFELTDKQEERKKQLEEYLEKLGEHLINLEERYKNLDLFSGSARNQIVIDKLKKEITQNEERFSEAQDELDSIEPYAEPTKKMISEKREELIDEASDDFIEWLKNVGLGSDLTNFVNVRGLAEDVVRSDGYGVLNSYDGTYDNVQINKKWYVTMRVE